MRTINEEKVQKLRLAGKTKTVSGERLKPVAPIPPPNNRQVLALEKIGAEIKALLRANSQNAAILMEMIKKEQPESWQEIEVQVSSRDKQNFIEKIRVRKM